MRAGRDYQIAAKLAVRAAFANGTKGCVIEVPTGGGKGFIIADLCKDVIAKGKRALVVVNRDELCNQLFASLKEQGLFPSMERGMDKASPMSDLVVASIQTAQNNRLAKWNPKHFSLIICDEVHGSASSTFKKTLGHFEASYHLGVTATLERHDKKGLASVYEKCVYSMTLNEAIEAGWLVNYEIAEIPVPIEVKISDLKVTNEKGKTHNASDEELEANVFEKGDYLPRIFAEAAEKSRGRKTLFFWPNCASSLEASKYFESQGIESNHIDGYMSKTQIADLLEWFKAPGYKCLHNADLLSVGYDNPSIDCIGIMRISRSLPLLKQRVGRGTRPLCRVDDYPTAELRKQAIAASSKPSFLILDLMVQMADRSTQFADATALITDNEEEREFLQQERKKGGVFTAEELATKLRVKRKTDEDKALAKLAEDAANAAMRHEAKKSGPYVAHILRREAKPHWKEASPKQIAYARRLGYNGEIPSALHASQIIDAYIQHNQKMQLT